MSKNGTFGRSTARRHLWCDGQGREPVIVIPTNKHGRCPACNKFVAKRADGTIRAHNGVGR